VTLAAAIVTVRFSGAPRELCAHFLTYRVPTTGLALCSANRNVFFVVLSLTNFNVRLRILSLGLLSVVVGIGPTARVRVPCNLRERNCHLVHVLVSPRLKDGSTKKEAFAIEGPAIHRRPRRVEEVAQTVDGRDAIRFFPITEEMVAVFEELPTNPTQMADGVDAFGERADVAHGDASTRGDA
jgi:hypothetical protein